MSNTITVRVPARLHLGFLDPSGRSSRRFGSIGLPLCEPATVVTLSRAVETVVQGPDSDLAAGHLAALCGHLGIQGQHRLVIHEAIPRHAGLGSGTQIALAVAAALRVLHNLPMDIPGDATLLARGGRSGVGIASFAEGGVIIDAGNDGSDRPPPVIARFPFPEAWRVILILDRAQSGLHGEDEMNAFRSLPAFPESGVGEICRNVLTGVMPALVENDLAAFGAAISAIQMLVGAHFAPAQGGMFTSKRVEAVACRLADAGAVGIGQSSWGPTGFAFASSEHAATKILATAHADFEEGVETRIVKGRNSGAEIGSTRLDLVGSR